MWKVLSVILFTVIKLGSCDVCSNKTEYHCNCKQYTDEKTHLPVYLASCTSRQIKKVPTQLEEDINYLDLSENEIQTLTSADKLSSNSLNILILKYNNIAKIEKEFLGGIPNLIELDLSNNAITAIEDSDFFQTSKLLTKIDLSYNQLKSLPEGIFSPLPNLKNLDISFNYMGEYLANSKSVLSSVLKVNPDLTHLSMNGLNISELHNAYFDDFKEMKQLSLADNNYTMIPTVPYSLEKLDLSGNQLTFISAKYLNYHSLKVLKLNRMPYLTQIHHYAFYNLIALEKLVINDCPNLNQFSELAFDVASKNIRLHPTYLSLARNGLEHLNASYRYFFKNMKHVDLRGNPWDCDCDILWLKEYDSVLYKSYEIRCSTPRSLRNRKVLELTEDDQRECYPGIYGKKSHRIAIIIMALIIILLCGLIFYLIKYPLSWLGSNRTVGPNSPYSPAATSEHI